MTKSEILQEIVEKLESLSDDSLKTVLKATDSCIVVEELKNLQSLDSKAFRELLAS